MQVEIAELLARREDELQTGGAATKAVSLAPRREDHAEARRYGRSALGFCPQLKAVVQQHIADAGGLTGAGKRQRVRELVRHPGRRPLLREAAVPRAATAARPREDVLEHAGLLIEGLFDQEGVVENLPFAVRVCRRCALGPGGNAGCQERQAQHKEKAIEV